jgi:hypothetical protein
MKTNDATVGESTAQGRRESAVSEAEQGVQDQCVHLPTRRQDYYLRELNLRLKDVVLCRMYAMHLIRQFVDLYLTLLKMYNAAAVQWWTRNNLECIP